MIMRKLQEFVGLAAVALAALAGTPASAAYPERPITIIVPWAPAAAPTPPRASWPRHGAAPRRARERGQPHRRLGGGRPLGDRDRAS